ncbi:cyclase family protein [Arthrobacter sp. TMP15]|uniref:cyclase family protein n=1 Tax=Arthrobacter sp. TMP15 TaxID=3140789 RepID=UPI0031BB3456
MHIVDLSQPVSSGMQVFPGDPMVSSRAVATNAADGFQVAELHLGTHSGTHVDAPLHTIDGGMAVDELNLTALCGPARIIRVLGAEPRSMIKFSTVAAQLENLTAGTIVLFHTGWSVHFNTPAYLEHPHLDPDIAKHLLAQGVSVIGVDTLNPDPTPEAQTDGPLHLPVHQHILGAGGAIIENLSNLAAVTWNNPIFAALPLRLIGLDGSPVRAVAMRALPA